MAKRFEKVNHLVRLLPSTLPFSKLTRTWNQPNLALSISARAARRRALRSSGALSDVVDKSASFASIDMVAIKIGGTVAEGRKEDSDRHEGKERERRDLAWCRLPRARGHAHVRPSLRRISQAGLEVSSPSRTSISTAACILTCTNFSLCMAWQLPLDRLDHCSSSKIDRDRFSFSKSFNANSGTWSRGRPSLASLPSPLLTQDRSLPVLAR